MKSGTLISVTEKLYQSSRLQSFDAHSGREQMQLTTSKLPHFSTTFVGKFTSGPMNFMCVAFLKNTLYTLNKGLLHIETVIQQSDPSFLLTAHSLY